MNLIIDIGNTCCKIALYDGVTMKEFCKADNRQMEISDDWCSCCKIDKAIVSSVVGIPQNIEEQISKLSCPVVYFNATMPLPVKILYKTPQTLGVDRLAAVIGAQGEAPGKELLVIDAGSAITYDFLDAQGNYHGGNISPGVNMRLRALHEFTSKLPLVASAGDVPALGYNTETAIRSGVLRGVAHEIEGYIAEIKAKYPSVLIFLTGGDEKTLIYNIKSCIFADEFLVLKGLNRILTFNDTI